MEQLITLFPWGAAFRAVDATMVPFMSARFATIFKPGHSPLHFSNASRAMLSFRSKS